MGKLTRAGLAACAVVVLVVQTLRPAVAAPADPVTTKDQVDKWMTELSNWGRWGKTDQIGTLNRWEFLLTAAAVPVLGGTGFPLNPIATF